MNIPNPSPDSPASNDAPRAAEPVTTPITYLMGVYNEEARIRTVLEHVVRWADEIIIVNKSSTDRTKQICEEYGPRVKVIDVPFTSKGHDDLISWTKLPANDWIYLGTASEIPTRKLIERIHQMLQSRGDSLDVVCVPRRIFSFGINSPLSPWNVGYYPFLIHRHRAIITNQIHHNFRPRDPGNMAQVDYAEDCCVYHFTHPGAKTYLEDMTQYFAAEVLHCPDPAAKIRECFESHRTHPNLRSKREETSLFGHLCAWQIYWLGTALFAWEKQRGLDVPQYYAQLRQQLVDREWLSFAPQSPPVVGAAKSPAPQRPNQGNGQGAEPANLSPFPQPLCGEDALLAELGNRKIAERIRIACIVGAHRFQEKALLDRIFPKLERIYLFEPVPELYALLQRETGSDPRVRVFPYAISDVNGRARFHVTDNEAASSSLLPLGKHKKIFPHVHVAHRIQVETRTLESVIDTEHLEKPDLLFLDVQGAEYRILASLSPAMRSRLALIYTEASKEELYVGARNLDALEKLLAPEFVFLGFAPLAASCPTHGNSLFANRALARAETKPTVASLTPVAPPLPSDARAFLQQAESHFNRAELVAAADCLERALKLAPDAVELLAALGSLRFQTGKVEAARASFAKACQLQPSNPALLVKLAAAAVQLQQFEEFESALGRALEVDPENCDALRLLADLNLQQGRFADAGKTYARIIRQTPKDVGALMALGRCLFEGGELETAQQVYIEVLRLEPGNSLAAENLAVVKRKAAQETARGISTNTPKTVQPEQNQPGAASAVPLVSAIVSTYNSESFIRGCLEDLVGQTLFGRGQLEIIVVDTGSPQNERAIVEEFQGRYPGIKYLRTEQRETIYAAWNRGIQTARGKYITNANTDDRHRADALEVMTAYLEGHPEVALVYADQLISDVPNETFADTRATSRWNWPDYSYAELERQCIIGPQPVWRRAVHEKHGLFDARLHSAGDYEFWLRIGKTETIKRLPDVLGVYYRNPQGAELAAGHSGPETEEIKAAYGILARGIQPAQTIPVPVSREELESLPFRSAGAQKQDTPQAPRVSVVIPCYDRPEALQQCLGSLALQTLSRDQFEVICVNDGSPNPAIAQVIRRAFQSLRGQYVQHSANLGRAHARNSGLRLAKGEFILFMDSDIVAHPGLLAEHLFAHESRRGEKVCILSHIASPPTQLGRSPLARALEESNLVLAWADLASGKPATYMHFYTGNVSIPRAAFESVGGFDEDFKSYGVEDTEYGWRLQQAGYPLLYRPQARCEHLAPDPTIESFAKRQHAVALNFTRFFRSHPRSLDDAHWAELKPLLANTWRRSLPAINPWRGRLSHKPRRSSPQSHPTPPRTPAGCRRCARS